MKTFYESDIRKRTLILSFILAAWFIAVVFQLIRLQVISHGRFKAAVIDQNQSKRTIQPKRGNIYDRNGALLACSVPAPSIGIRPAANETPAQVSSKVRKLQAALDLSPKRAAEIVKVLGSKVPFTYVKRQVSEEEAARVRSLELANVTFDQENRRSYPKGPLAAQVLGWVNRDGNGSGGIEFLFDAHLKGREGEQIVFLDKNQVGYQTMVLKDPVPGRDLRLTIDETIQYIAEKELLRAVDDNQASWGTVIISDPFTGEILAMASAPAFDLNNPGSDTDVWRNRAVLENFEPGSTFKIVAAAAALEKGVVRFSDVFDCRAGSIIVGGKPITDHVRLGVLSFPEVIIQSSNVGTAQLAMRIGRADFHESILRFGFGEKTGVDLPGEQRGIVRAVKDWNPVYSLPHIAIGYEVMATALQVLRAMNVFATGGWLVKPRILKSPEDLVSDRNGDGSPPVRVLDEALAFDLVHRVFEKVVEEGTAKSAKLEDYGIAGKTGTARKYDPRLGGYTSRYVASFVGFAPVDRPRLSMIVVLDDPKKVNFFYGGQVAAPVFRDIARQVLRYLKVPPERKRSGPIIVAGLNRETAP